MRVVGVARQQLLQDGQGFIRLAVMSEGEGGEVVVVGEVRVLGMVFGEVAG